MEFFIETFFNFHIDQSTALQMVAILDFWGVTGTPVSWKLLNIEERN